MRKLSKLVLARVKTLRPGVFFSFNGKQGNFFIGDLVKDISVTPEPNPDNWNFVEPILINDDFLELGNLVYHIDWGVVGRIIGEIGKEVDIDWGEYNFLCSKRVEVSKLRNVIGMPNVIGYLAHGYGKYPDDAFYDLVEAFDIKALVDRGYCYLEYEQVLKHRMGGRILRGRQDLNKNLSGYDYVWVPREFKGKYILHYEDKA